MCGLRANEDLKRWIRDFLAPRSFQIKTNRVIGVAKMTGGPPQGSPLSPNIFRIYMSAMVRRAEELDEPYQAAKHSNRMNTRATGLKRSFESLQFIDDCNSIVHGSVKDMDRALGKAAEEFKLKWDHSKDWNNGVHLGVNLNAKKHQKYRENKGNTAFQLVRRLSRLPPGEKKK